MIQRKQTVFLALAALCLVLTYFLPLVVYTQQPDARIFTLRTDALHGPDGLAMEEAELMIPFQWVYAFLIVGLVGSIFLFKQRPRQRRIVRGLFLVTLGCFVGQAFVHQSVASYLGTSINVRYVFQVAFFLPLVAVVLTWLAERGIKADEDLVKSTDRLR